MCVVSVSVFDSAGIDLAHPVVATWFLGPLPVVCSVCYFSFSI